MELQDILSFEGFQEIWGVYGYDNDLPEMIEREFSRIKGLSTFMSFGRLHGHSHPSNPKVAYSFLFHKVQRPSAVLFLS